MAGAAPSVEVMAGAGVRPCDVARLAAAVHLSAKRPAPARTWVPMGTAGSSATADTHFVTDPYIVATARTAIDAAISRARTGTRPRPRPGPSRPR
jgi:copper homeostasis protein